MKYLMLFPGLRDTEDLKDCVKEIFPLQDNQIKTLTVKGTHLCCFTANIVCMMAT